MTKIIKTYFLSPAPEALGLWRNISKDKFLKSYNKSDEIYDQI